MTNTEIYKKTLGFSIRKLLVDILSFILFVGLCAVGYVILDKTTNMGLLGLLIGLVVGLIVVILISRFVSYKLKAGQIAMMTRGVTENSLPDNVIAEGKAVVKERFATVAAYFAITSVIKGIFNQLGRAITRVGEAIGGDTGSAIGSTISTVIQVIVSYLCDCCLGWVFYRKEISAPKATCEGAVIFFKHGKTLAKNLGRVFGLGLLSLLIVGGIFGGIAYLIFSSFGTAFQTLAAEITEAAARGEVNIPPILQDPKTLMLVAAGLVGLIFWSFIHSTFIRPFVLTGVLRNYMESGKNDIPSEESFRMLDSKSAKFAKLHREAL